MTANYIFLSFLFLSTSLFANDPLESLIESEGRSESVDENSELPSIFLFGDKNAIKIFSPGTRELVESWLCRSLELDELLEASRADTNALEVKLNLSIPRVRKVFEDACLIRVGDFLIAHTPGFQVPVTVTHFIVRREPIPCEKESPLTLWAAFEETLDQPPLLFSTILDVPQGENRFKNINQFENINADETARKRVQSKVRFLEDFDLWIKPLDDERLKTLIHARRKTVGADDNGLPNEMLLVDYGSDMEEVWVERVDIHHGSGHIRPLAIWDYNGDGLLDLWIEGDHRACPYRILLTGQDHGFEVEDLPNEPCECQ